MRLLLASHSETRRTMLEGAGVAFQATASEIDESGAKAGLIEAGFEPRDIAEMLAEMKARGVDAQRDALVLGADQVLERDDGTMLSKVGSREQAALQLRSLSGRVHFLHSAAVLFERGERVWGQTETVEMAMRPLSEAYIQAYLDSEYEKVRGSVGCYRIEGRGAQLFDEVWGSHFAVLGLPLLPLLSYLRERGLIGS